MQTALSNDSNIGAIRHCSDNEPAAFTLDRRVDESTDPQEAEGLSRPRPVPEVRWSGVRSIGAYVCGGVVATVGPGRGHAPGAY
jgi:hypothetical protein